MKRIINESGEVAIEQLEELLNGLGMYAIGQNELAELFRAHIGGNPNRLRHMMPDLGWRTERVKWGGVDYARVLYCHQAYRVDRGYVLGPNEYREPIVHRPQADFNLTQLEVA